jgi:hypothetical protein
MFPTPNQLCILQFLHVFFFGPTHWLIPLQFHRAELRSSPGGGDRALRRRSWHGWLSLAPSTKYQVPNTTKQWTLWLMIHNEYLWTYDVNSGKSFSKCCLRSWFMIWDDKQWLAQAIAGLGEAWRHLHQLNLFQQLFTPFQGSTQLLLEVDVFLKLTAADTVTQWTRCFNMLPSGND